MFNLRRLIFNSGSTRAFIDVFKVRQSVCYCTVESPPGTRTKPSVEDTIPKGLMGQPTCHSHPHLMAPGELTCGITQLEYKDRRSTFMDRLAAQHGNNEINHIAIIPASSKQYMSDKIPYVHRQHSDFFYLTGCLEPSAVLVLTKQAYSTDHRSILFCHQKDHHAELWEGPRTGCTEAVKLFAVDEARPLELFKSYISRSAVSFRPFVFWFGAGGCTNPEVAAAVKKALEKDSTVFSADPKRVLDRMRLIKSPAEVEMMKEACTIGSQAINMAMAYTKPDISESEVNAILEYAVRRGGGEHLAFPPVVAGGPRATHIHYVNNNQLLRNGELLLVDAGAQRWLYNSDISRTWPVSGKFSDSQKVLYEVVLTVQKRLLELLRDQKPTLDQLFESMCRLHGKYLKEAGIIPKSCEGSDLIAKAYRLCPHHVSHYLGLDIHDTGEVKRNEPLKNNMIVTVEPGIYTNMNDETVPREFRGIGIRIEDDVLIKENGIEVLTDLCKKEVSDIENHVGTCSE